MTGCKRVQARECKFCDRFWRAVITYGLPLAIGGCGGVAAAFYWAGTL